MRNILIVLGFLALLGGCDRQKPVQQQAASDAPDASKPSEALAEERGGPGLDRSHKGAVLLDIAVHDPDGESVPLASLRKPGKPLLLNLWATWCAPCIKELPTLDRLGNAPGAPQVIALSQDQGEQAKISSFLADRNLGLEPFHDPDMAASSALGVQIMPTTVLYDRAGKEVWRYSGGMDWAGPEAAKLLAEAG